MRGVIKLLGSEVRHIFLRIYPISNNCITYQQFFLLLTTQDQFLIHMTSKFENFILYSATLVQCCQEIKNGEVVDFFLHFFCGFLKHYDRVRMGPQGGELIRRSWMVVSRRCSAAQCWRWRQGRLDASRRRRLREEGEEQEKDEKPSSICNQG